VYFDLEWSRWLAATIPVRGVASSSRGPESSSQRNAGKSSTKNCARTSERRNRRREDSLLNRGAWNWIR
jgi:hypothetical protein